MNNNIKKLSEELTNETRKRIEDIQKAKEKINHIVSECEQSAKSEADKYESEMAFLEAEIERLNNVISGYVARDEDIPIEVINDRDIKKERFSVLLRNRRESIPSASILTEALYRSYEYIGNANRYEELNGKLIKLHEDIDKLNAELHAEMCLPSGQAKAKKILEYCNMLLERNERFALPTSEYIFDYIKAIVEDKPMGVLTEKKIKKIRNALSI